MRKITDEVNIHYDCDGVLRNFHRRAMKLFFTKYPEFEKYLLPVKKFRGWDWNTQLKVGPEAEKISALMDVEIFGNPDLCYDAFANAEPFVSPQEWKHHIGKLRKIIPNANITISTHQYNNISRAATIDFLSKNEFTDQDEINVLFTGRKTLFGAHFLLDDKPDTIESFHSSLIRVGVLYLNPDSNGWYLRAHNNKINVPYASSLEDYYVIIKDCVTAMEWETKIAGKEVE